MAGKVTQSVLLSKLGGDLIKAHESVKNDPADYGNIELPSGIRNGTAKLVDCRITEIEAGKPDGGKCLFMARGSVVDPVEFNGTVIKGLFTTIMEPLFETPKRARKTIKEHMAWMYNELRILGINTASLKVENLVAIMDELVKKGVYFRFRTWGGDVQTEGPYKGKPGFINHEWQGKVDWKPKVVVGGSFTEASSNGTSHPAPEPKVPDTLPPDTSKSSAEIPPSQEEIKPEDLDQSDLTSLVARAIAGDHEPLCALALANGISQEQIDQAPDWNTLGEMLSNKGVGGEEEEEMTVSVGDHFLFHPYDPKTKNPAKVPVTVEITTLNDDNTWNGKQVKNPKVVYSNVSMEALVPIT